MIWKLMRDAAIERHRWVHEVFEGGDPSRWAAHEAVIRAFYGW
jgi:hypothetical protein